MKVTKLMNPSLSNLAHLTHEERINLIDFQVKMSDIEVKGQGYNLQIWKWTCVNDSVYFGQTSYMALVKESWTR